MKRTFSCGVGVMAIMGAWGQCSFTVSADFHITCVLGSTHVDVSVLNGVPPFQIEVQRYDMQVMAWLTKSQAVGNGTSTQVPLTYYDWFGASQGRVRVTDATNCLVEYTTSIQSIAIRQFMLGQTLDCNTGAIYADVWISGTGNPPTPLWTYSWDQGTTLPFAPNWTYISGGPSGYVRYRSNAPVSPGQHLLLFPQFYEAPFQYCQDFVDGSLVGVTAGDCGVNFRMRAALDGALPSGTVMTDGLRSANLIPTAQPYTALGYTFVGSPTNVTIAPSLLTVTGNDAIVDWVIVELLSNTSTVTYSKPALLQADGDVIDTDGDAYLNFPVAVGNYYVALRHRNHLGVRTSSTKALTVDPLANLIDLRLASTGTNGPNSRVLKGTVYCLWAGDATGNGQLKYTGSGNDRDPILIAVGSTTPNNTVPNVYDRRDTNLDGVIKYTGSANDRDIILTNVGSTTPNNTRTQQLP